MPYPISNDGYDDVIDKLWDSADWKKLVFGVKKVARYNVNSFIFQLLATGILCFEWTTQQLGLYWCLLKTMRGYLNINRYRIGMGSVLEPRNGVVPQLHLHHLMQ